MTVPTPSQEWYSIEEVATWLGLGRETVRRWVHKKKLPAFQEGLVIRIHVKALQEFILEGSTI
jgi:excisionase family DNA binding protein